MTVQVSNLFPERGCFLLRSPWACSRSQLASVCIDAEIPGSFCAAMGSAPPDASISLNWRHKPTC